MPKTSIPIQDQARYEEATNIMRHFSENVMDMRKVTIAQGLVILSGALFLTTKNQHLFSLAATAFGMLFTFVLSMLHGNYLNFMLATVKYIKEDLEEFVGPWTICWDARYLLLGTNSIRRVTVEKGPFILIGLALFIVALYNILSLCGAIAPVSE